jgi:hypothetical protein
MCDISTLSKYVNRPSPPRPANDPACHGRLYIGNDGALWRSVATASGVYRWQKVSDSPFPRRTPKKKAKRSPKKSAKRSPKKSAKRSPKKSAKRSPMKKTKRSPKKSDKRSPKHYHKRK